MAEELHRDEFGVVTLYPEDRFLELKWLPGSANMTDAAFMHSTERFAGFAEQSRTPNLLVDVTEFNHTPGAEFGPWRDEHIIPRYNGAGAQRFAFLVPPASSTSVESGIQPTVEGPGTFLTGYFKERSHILDWFAAQTRSLRAIHEGSPK
jgi:hypothetical protein